MGWRAETCHSALPQHSVCVGDTCCKDSHTDLVKLGFREFIFYDLQYLRTAVAGDDDALVCHVRVSFTFLSLRFLQRIQVAP